MKCRNASNVGTQYLSVESGNLNLNSNQFGRTQENKPSGNLEVLDENWSSPGLIRGFIRGSGP